MDKIDRINVWYDNAWPHLDVVWLRRNGYLTATENDNLDVWVDLEGNILGFMLTGIRRYKGESFTANLHPVAVAEKVGGVQSGEHNVASAVDVAVVPLPGPIEQIRFQYDESGDSLEVCWDSAAAKPIDTTDERVKAFTDATGKILGFKVSGISLMGEGERDFINADIYPAKSEYTRP